mgnify:CR=1 FL=1
MDVLLLEPGLVARDHVQEEIVDADSRCRSSEMSVVRSSALRRQGNKRHFMLVPAGYEQYSGARGNFPTPCFKASFLPFSAASAARAACRARRRLSLAPDPREHSKLNSVIATSA